MPSANPVYKMSSAKEYLTQPMKPAIVIVEHKIRNLEKRKAKLDQYKSEQDDGKELNADQLAAVAKYGEVIQQLEFARDLVKQFTQVNEETRREIKKDLKAEQADRSLAEIERLRDFFKIQALINEMKSDPSVWDDFLVGAEGTPNVDKDVFVRLSSDPFLQMVPIRRMDNDYEMAVDTLSTNWMNLIEGSKKEYTGSGGKTTFRKMKEALMAMTQSEYFTTKASRFEVPVDEVLSDAESATAIPEEEPVITNSIPFTESVVTAPAVVVPVQESTYSFLQESQIDIDSPQMDPAVVAVSSSVPPPQLSQAEFQRPVYNNSSNASPHSANTTSSMEELKTKPHELINIDNDINQWNANLINNESEKGKQDKEDDKGCEWGENGARFGSYRGGSRGRVRRGNANGFNRGSGPPRGGLGGSRGRGGGGGNGDFTNGRMGYYRPEAPENGFDNKEPRGGRGGGRGYSRSIVRGVSQGNNFNNYNNSKGTGNGGSFRGARGNNRPQRNENNGVTTQCY